MKDGEPWFVLADVCKVLEISNPRNVKDRLSSDNLVSVRTMDAQNSRGQMRATTWVDESGLYDVILDSRLDQADFDSTEVRSGSQSRRVIAVNEPWFVASDVCKALDIKNTAQALAKVNEDDVCSTYTIDRLGRSRKVNAVNESGL